MTAELARQLRAAADAGDQAAFDEVARTLGGGWIEALCSTCDPEHLAVLADRFAEIEDMTRRAAWIDAAGPEAGYAVARWCATAIATMDRYARGAPYAGHRIVDALVAYLHAQRMRVEPGWLWVELIAAVPHHKRALGEQLGYRARGILMWRMRAPIEHVLRGPRCSFRGLLGHFLADERAVDIDRAIEWLADPALRPTAETVLRNQIGEAAPALRAAIERSTGGARDAAVRLLRAEYPRIAIDGKTATDDDATLQTRLRARPDDAEAAAVWADLLGARGDPRGEHITLELAIRAAVEADDPARALELSRAQAELAGREHKRIWGKPAGFPYREKYRGRSRVGFLSDWNHRIRRGNATLLVDRLEAFIYDLTDAHGPVEIHHGRHLDGPSGDASRRDQADDRIARELVRCLGDDVTVFADDDHFFVRRERTDVALADPAGLRALWLANPNLTMIYELVLTWPGTEIALPHQEGAHYAGGEAIENRLAIHLATRDIQLDLTFPYESFRDPQFLAIHDAIVDVLGRVLPAGRFMMMSPSADGQRMVSRLERFDR
jgi:hypothetical protein